MVRRTPEEAAQTRRALLDAALDVFSDRGAANGTLKDVAACAEVTHGALYWHFKDREAVLRALFESSELPFDRHYLEQLQAARQDALEALEGYLKGLIRDIMADDRSRKIFRLFYTGSDTSRELAALSELRRTTLEQPLSHIGQFLKLARKQELIGIKKRELEPQARAILSLLLGVLQSSLLIPDLVAGSGQGGLLIRNCIEGLRATQK